MHTFPYQTPRLVRAFFIAMLRFYFTEHPKYKWNSDSSKSEIFIVNEFPDLRHENIIPTVVVENGATAYSDDGIGSNVSSAVFADNTPFFDSFYQFTAHSSISIHAICESAIEVEELATEIAMYLMSIKASGPARVLQLQHLGMPRQSQPRAIVREGYNPTFDCVLAMEYSFVRKVKRVTVQEGELLSAIHALCTAEAPKDIPNKDATDAGFLDSPFGRGAYTKFTVNGGDD